MSKQIPNERLDPGSYIPLYKQLYYRLQKDIQKGVYKKNERLPSERELITLFEVSRITAKSALDELVQNGYAFRRAGLGTFVGSPKISGLSGFSSFSDDMRMRGLTPSSKVVASKLIDPTDEIAKWLELAPGDRCIHLERIRFANNEPVALEDAYLPAKYFTGLENEDLETNSMFDIMLRKFGMRPTWAEGKIEAGLPNQKQAKLLDIRQNEPVLVVHRITYNDMFVPLEWVLSVYRADRFSFSTGRQLINNEEK